MLTIAFHVLFVAASLAATNCLLSFIGEFGPPPKPRRKIPSTLPEPDYSKIALLEKDVYGETFEHAGATWTSKDVSISRAEPNILVALAQEAQKKSLALPDATLDKIS